MHKTLSCCYKMHTTRNGNVCSISSDNDSNNNLHLVSSSYNILLTTNDKMEDNIGI